jgi:hypothetical protein
MSILCILDFYECLLYFSNFPQLNQNKQTRLDVNVFFPESFMFCLILSDGEKSFMKFWRDRPDHRGREQPPETQNRRLFGR